MTLAIGVLVLAVQAPAAALPFGASSLWSFTVAGVLMALMCAAIAVRHRPLVLAAAGAALYTVSGIVVTVIGGIPTNVAPHHISQAAQVTLSLVWVGIGVGALGAALARRSPLLRRCGMGILALAAAKALILDTSALTSVARSWRSSASVWSCFLPRTSSRSLNGARSTTMSAPARRCDRRTHRCRERVLAA